MNDQISNIVLLISAGFLWVYLFWLYADFRIDQFRQEMFAIRDELFDEAVKGAISFDDDAYGIIRVTANGMIRYAHLLSITHMVATAIWARHNSSVLPEPPRDRLSSSLARLGHEKREIYNAYRRRMRRAVVKHILLAQPVLLFSLLVPAWAYFAATSIVDRSLLIFEPELKRMDEIAYVSTNPYD